MRIGKRFFGNFSGAPVNGITAVSSTNAHADLSRIVAQDAPFWVAKVGRRKSSLSSSVDRGRSNGLNTRRTRNGWRARALRRKTIENVSFTVAGRVYERFVARSRFECPLFPSPIHGFLRLYYVLRIGRTITRACNVNSIVTYKYLYIYMYITIGYR